MRPEKSTERNLLRFFACSAPGSLFQQWYRAVWAFSSFIWYVKYDVYNESLFIHFIRMEMWVRLLDAEQFVWKDKAFGHPEVISGIADKRTSTQITVVSIFQNLSYFHYRYKLWTIQYKSDTKGKYGNWRIYTSDKKGMENATQAGKTSNILRT